MFCTTLRKREEWSSVPSTLLSQQQPKWQEQILQTHDLAIPLPRDGTQGFFKAILLSPTEMRASDNYMSRIERLYHQSSEKNVGIIFLVHDEASQESGIRSLMNLQISLMPNLEIPIIPLFSVPALQKTLFGFQRQMIQTWRATSSTRLGPVTTLLPYCSINAPIPEHTRNVLSDICHSIPQISQAATSEDGQACLKSYLEDGSPGTQGLTAGITEFWTQEYIVDA